MGDMKLEALDQSNERDVVFVFETRRHPGVVPMLFGEPPKTLNDHREWLRTNVPARRLMFVLKEDGVPVGYCHAKPSTCDVEVGFVVHPDFQGKGKGRFMVRELGCQVKKIFPGLRVILRVRADNMRARRVYYSAGFEARSMYMDGDVAKMEYEMR